MDDGLPDLPDIDLDKVLPDLPELEDFFEPPTECPVCDFLEERVCRPHMTHGDSARRCAKDFKATLDRLDAERLAKEDRMRELLPVFEKYGIDPNVRLGPRK